LLDWIAALRVCRALKLAGGEEVDGWEGVEETGVAFAGRLGVMEDIRLVVADGLLGWTWPGSGGDVVEGCGSQGSMWRVVRQA
jgi:hypothetical protein